MVAQRKLCVGIPLVGRPAVPFQRNFVVLPHAPAGVVRESEVVLRTDVSLFGRKPVPRHGCLVVLSDATAGVVHVADGNLCRRVALFGSPPEPHHRHLVVPTDVTTFLVPLAKLRLRASVTLVRHQPEPGDIERGNIDVCDLSHHRVDHGSGLYHRLYRDRLRRRRHAQVVLPHQRLILVRTLLAVRRRQHLGPHPPEQKADLQRLLQMRQQRRRVWAVPTPTVRRRRRTRRRRIRHQRLVAQQVFIQVPEAAPAHAPAGQGPLHRPRQRIVPARVQDHQPQGCAQRRRQHVLQRHRLEAHVDVALETRVHRHQVVDAVHLDAVARVEHQRHVRPQAPARERPQGLVQLHPAGVELGRHLEAEPTQRRRDVRRVVLCVRELPDVGVRILTKINFPS